MKKANKKNQLEEKLNIAYQKGKELKIDGASKKEVTQNQKKVKKLENKLTKVTSKTPPISEQNSTLNTTRKIESSKFKSTMIEDEDSEKISSITEKIQDNESSVSYAEEEAIDKIIISNSMERINQFIVNEKRLNVLEAAECKLFLLKIS